MPFWVKSGAGMGSNGKARGRRQRGDVDGYINNFLEKGSPGVHTRNKKNIKS